MHENTDRYLMGEAISLLKTNPVNTNFGKHWSKSPGYDRAVASGAPHLLSPYPVFA